MSLFELKLDDGRTIRASSVLIRSTYAGLLEGYPITPINDAILDRATDEAMKSLGDWPVHVVDPPRVTKHRERRLPLGPEERLPACWLAGAFDSLAIDDTMHASSAILVWFQDEPFPFPVEPALSQLRGVQWDAIARDFRY